MKENIYYIAYSFIEDENSANQIQSRETFESLVSINKDIKGIFLGNKGSIRNPFWRIRREDNKYFIDRFDFVSPYIEEIFKLSIIRKNLFPYLFAKRCQSIIKRDGLPKTIYMRITSPEEGTYYIRNLKRLNIRRIFFELHNLNFDIPNFYYWNFEKKYCYQKYLQFFNLLKNNPKKAKLVTLTNALAGFVRNKFNYKENIDVIPDAHNFISDKPKDINFNKEKIEIIYTGLTFRNRGVKIVVKALEFLPDNFYLRLVGGRKHERENLKRKYSFFIKQQKLILEQPVSCCEIKEKLINADIAILPTPLLGLANFTSPLKLFDYMATGMPIIASDTQSFREILSSENSLFFEENNSKNLAEKIKYLASNQEIAKKISKNVLHDSKKYTYLERAKKILIQIKN